MVIKKLLGTSVLSFLAKLTMLGATVVLARSLGAEQYGKYVYWISILNLLVALSTSGVPALLNKVIPDYKQNSRNELVNGLYFSLNCILLMITPMIFILIFFGTDENIILALSVSLLTLIKGNLIIITSYANAIKLHNFVPIYRYLIPNFLLIVIFYLITLTPKLSFRSSFEFAICIILISTLFTALLCGAHLKRADVVWKYQPIMIDTKIWLPLLLSLTGISFVATAGHELSSVIIAKILSFEQVAIWKIATQGFFLSMLANSVINQYLMPMMSLKYSQQRLQDVQDELKQGAILSTLCSLAALIIIALAGHTIIHFLFGEVYIKATTPLMILLAFQVAGNQMGSSITLLSMSGMQTTALKLSALISIIYILGTVVLTYFIGINGSAIALGSSFLLHRIIASYLVHKEHNIYTGITFRQYK